MRPVNCTFALCSLTSIVGSAKSAFIWSWAPQLAAEMSDFLWSGPPLSPWLELNIPWLELERLVSDNFESISSTFSSDRLFLYRFQAWISIVRTISTFPPPFLVCARPHAVSPELFFNSRLGLCLRTASTALTWAAETAKWRKVFPFASWKSASAPFRSKSRAESRWTLFPSTIVRSSALLPFLREFTSTPASKASVILILYPCSERKLILCLQQINYLLGPMPYKTRTRPDNTTHPKMKSIFFLLLMVIFAQNIDKRKC